jgi:hypothetical protein
MMQETSKSDYRGSEKISHISKRLVEKPPRLGKFKMTRRLNEGDSRIQKIAHYEYEHGMAMVRGDWATCDYANDQIRKLRAKEDPE